MKSLLFLLLCSCCLVLSAQYKADVYLSPSLDTLHANEPILITYCLAIEKAKVNHSKQQEPVSFLMVENGQFQRTPFSGQNKKRHSRIDSFCYSYLMLPQITGLSSIPTGRFMRGDQILAETEKQIWISTATIPSLDSLNFLETRRGNTDTSRYRNYPAGSQSQVESLASLQIEKSQFSGKVSERLPIRYTFNRTNAEWIIPSLPEFRLMTVTKGYTIRLSRGGTEYVEARTLHLIPQEAGSFELPPCITVYEGDSVKSEGVKILIKE
jgi:hypothetical protein